MDNTSLAFSSFAATTRSTFYRAPSSSPQIIAHHFCTVRGLPTSKFFLPRKSLFMFLPDSQQHLQIPLFDFLQCSFSNCAYVMSGQVPWFYKSDAHVLFQRKFSAKLSYNYVWCLFYPRLFITKTPPLSLLLNIVHVSAVLPPHFRHFRPVQCIMVPYTVHIFSFPQNNILRASVQPFCLK
ncbi:hypothetical protein T4B_7929, partial [Trichinella pseudospiralis]